MNVMAEAHKRTKAFIAKGECLMSYAAVLRVTLRHCHSEYKAMQTTPEQKAAILHFQTTIDKYLEASNTLHGWVQVFPESMMLVNAEVGTVANLKNVPTYANIEDARRFNGRVGNKAGEVCVMMGAQTYISRQIGALEKQIRDIKSA